MAIRNGRWCPQEGGGTTRTAILGVLPRTQATNLVFSRVVVAAVVVVGHQVAKSMIGIHNEHQDDPLQPRGGPGVPLVRRSWYLRPPGWRRSARGWACKPCGTLPILRTSGGLPPLPPMPLLYHPYQLMRKPCPFRPLTRLTSQNQRKVVTLPSRQPRPLGRGLLFPHTVRGPRLPRRLRPDQEDLAIGSRTSVHFPSQSLGTSTTRFPRPALGTNARGHGQHGSYGYDLAGLVRCGETRRRSTAC